MRKALLYLSFFILMGPLQAQMKKFSHLNVEDGLSQNTVNCILKDTKGYLWIGTNDGLNKYDGYDFVTYKNHVEDQHSLSNNKIYCLLEDQSEHLWVGTSNGLNIYNKNKDNFDVLADYPALDILGESFIRSLFEDSEGNVWVGTLGKGLYKWDTKQADFIRIPLGTGAEIGDMDQHISFIYEDQVGQLWVTTKAAGIYQLDKISLKCQFFPFQTKHTDNEGGKSIYEDASGKLWVATEGQGVFFKAQADQNFQQFELRPDVPQNKVVKGIIEDDFGHLWFATDGGGIYIYDPTTDHFDNLKHDIFDPASIGSNGIYALFKDDQGIVWIGSFDGGISIYNRHNKPFHHKSVDPRPNKGLTHRSVLCFVEDHQNRVWIGTDGGGLNCFYPESQKFESFDHLGSESKGINNKVITSLYEDSQHRIWLGTYRGGLQCFIPGQGITQSYMHDALNQNSIRENNVWSITQDQDDILWIGTLEGLDRFDPETKRFYHVKTQGEKGNIAKERVTELYVDRNNQLWVGGKGLRFYDAASNQLLRVAENNDQLLSQFDIRELFEDSQGNFWIGTEGGGLYLLDRETFTIKRFTTTEGLPSNVIHNIMEAADHTLWISTNNGLCKISKPSLLLQDQIPSAQNFKNYCQKDGLQSNQFSYNAGLKTASGWLYFGGVNGFNYFDPSAISDNIYKPTVEITALKIFDQVVTSEQENSPLGKHISELSTLTLNHAQNQMFSLEFTALNFTSSEKNQYAYKLDGFMDDWSYIGEQRSVTLSNLDPGHYTLSVKAANNDGLWSTQEKTLKLHILPPYWKTKLAFTLYILIFIGLLYAFRKIMLVRERLKHDLEIKELEKQKVEEVNKIKLSFFTDISHEFRTPLTLIQAPVDELLESQNLNNDEKIQIGLIKNNTNRLLRLIDQLLQFRKVNDKKLNLRPENIELIDFLTQIIESFRGLAMQKQIQLKLETKIEELRVHIDVDKLEKVIYNLLSNAFKYTKTEVTLHVECCENQELTISVTDDGMGIPQEDQALIFDRYYKVKAHKYGNGYTGAHGTGIGLAYSKALVEVMKGKIEVRSQLGQGSTFQMKFPVPTAAQRPLHLDAITSSRPEVLTSYLETNYQIPSLVAESNGKRATLLIVEDHKELRWTLKRRLGKHYQILEAEDGAVGVQMALEHLPDIILSDIMMPKQDGIALCAQLKKDDRTSHIPILLLTANTNEEKCLAGFNTGAEAYITKPFNFPILEARLRSVLEARRRLKKYYSANIISPEEVHVPSADDQFLKKAVAIIEEQMDNSEFGVNEFAKALGMSRSVLYRKFSVLMEYPVKEFINMIRLKRAAQLFESDPSTSVSSVAYSVGFTDAQYFSKKFKKFYHLTPTQYINQQKKTSKELPL